MPDSPGRNLRTRTFLERLMFSYVALTMFYVAALVIPIAMCIYLLVLIARFVKAHQRCADALEMIAQKVPNSTEN
jgi:hypothetical protein